MDKSKKEKKSNKKQSMGAVIVRRMLKSKSCDVGLVIVFLLIVMALLAPVIMPYNYAAINVTERFMRPCAKHLLGTDQFGRDVLSRIMYGARYSLQLGIESVAIGVFFGAILGSICGFFGGKVDLIIMRILDIVSAIPGMLLAVVISAALGSGFYKCVLAIGISGIPGYCRMLRGSIMATRDNEYVEAATAINCSKFRIIAKHVFPNAMSPIIVQATMSIASGITMAAGLAYIGLGVQPPNPEWGAMLSDAKNYIRDYPYLVVIPGAVIMLTVLAMNLIGDALRDAMDPKLKH